MALTDRPYRPRRITSLRPEAMGQEIDRDRDELAAVIDDLRQRVRQLESEPVMFAWAIGITDGAGGISVRASYGGTLDINGSAVRLRFDQPRSSTEYMAQGTTQGSEVVSIASLDPSFYAVDSVSFRAFDMGTATLLDARTEVFEALVWASGPRV